MIVIVVTRSKFNFFDEGDVYVERCFGKAVNLIELIENLMSRWRFPKFSGAFLKTIDKWFKQLNWKFRR